MINTKKLIKMARKWQNVAVIRRKRISLPRSNENSNSTTVADKGHFVIYTADRRRFEFPIVYLNNYIFRELFRISEEEFGIPCDGPIIFPCDAIFMEYVVSLIQKRAGGDMEKALLMSMATCGCSLLFLWWRVVVCGGISMAGRVVSSFSWTTQWYESFKWLHLVQIQSQRIGLKINLPVKMGRHVAGVKINLPVKMQRSWPVKCM